MNIIFENNKFTCPACLKTVHISGYRNGKYINHFNCILGSFLFHTDVQWNITEIADYKNRINKFFNSDEYTTVIKQEILKQL